MTVVVKIGGARAVDPVGALADVAHLVANGESAEPRSADNSSGQRPREDVIVVHGGSTAVDETLEELDEEPTYVETPGGVVGRFTDERTMDVFKMVMPGKLNTDLVEALQNEGVDAVGLSGVDGQLLSGKRKSAVRVQEDGKKKIKRGDHSGTIEDVNSDLLETLLAGGYVPVVGGPVLGAEKDGGYTAVNADADRTAAAVAGALEADLVLLTDVSGIYADPEDESTKIDEATTEAEYEAVEEAAEGFMTKKVMAATEALESGARSVVVADANANDPVSNALEGYGTTITPGALGLGLDGRGDGGDADGSGTDDDDVDDGETDETAALEVSD
ncbi:acetylglutamate/acetylaminoadipate kinase [Natronosalvus caseinilyticus]|uniref:acetylglutamate/acetylaminoadipate kinase n=1 Tax=Natronosalvus caseinilyticus TaxID=2953747 RepID=UPI0028B19105|nr:acetylglutamate/acetylaminoadipate kinase [Natronosalvus caseinilyticus]